MSEQPSSNVSKTAVQIIAGISSFIMPFTLSSVTIALKSIGEYFNLDAVALNWVATAYLLSTAAFLVPFGRIGDIYGRKKVFLVGVSIDAAGSLLCAFSQSGAWLIAFRAMQGLGGAMIFGTAIAILTSVFPPQERGRALGMNTAAVYTGLSAGPLIGGTLTQHMGWQSIFLLNALLGLTLITVVLWKLKGEWAGSRGEKFDFAGALIYCVALVALIYGFSELPSLKGLWLIIIGAAGLAAFAFWEARTKYPVLQVSFFLKNRVFRYSNLAALINYSATNSVAFLLSLYLQYIKGFKADSAGFILVLQPVIMVICSVIAGRLSDRIEPRIISSTGMALTTIGLVMLIFLNNNTSLAYILVILAVLGLGFGFFSSPNTNAVMSSVDKKFYGVASGTLGTMRVVGQTTSLAISLLLFALYIGKVEIMPSNYPAFLTSMKTAFIISAALCFAGIFASIVRGKTHQTEQGKP
ncbi:MAG TPA: MFS transporter [Dehalococcoidales bacterium]|nr:MFS transporter [Dehalococcoidales bacterium]